MKYTDYREAKTHGSAEFPFQYYYIDKSHAQYVMPLHWHGEVEVLRVLEGELALWIDNERMDMKAGDVAFISGGSLHRGEPQNCRYDCVVFSPRLIGGRLGSKLSELTRPLSAGRAGLLPRCTAAEPAACALLDAAQAEGPYHELKLASLVAELIYELCLSGAVRADHAEGKRHSHRRAMIALLIDWIEKNYSERITLGQLAALAGVNEKYLCRFFKEFTGYTPTDYINRLRVERACYEMRINHRNVTEAAYECGFNEISYFSKCFKRYKGVSPGQYKL